MGLLHWFRYWSEGKYSSKLIFLLKVRATAKGLAIMQDSR